jgi:DNA-binding GntR family transcriptional regulator
VGNARGRRTRDTTTRGERSVVRLDNKTLRERVHAHLKDEILANRIAPGSVLQEVPLAESLGVSRGPIREALGSLAAEGLVTITPRRGAVVTRLTKRDFLEAYQVREALEQLAVRLAVSRMTSAELDEAEARIKEMIHCSAAGDDNGFFEANAAFHNAFVVASGNSKLLEVYDRLVGQMGPYRRPSVLLRGSLDRSIAEHQSIMVAARARDGERAAALVVDHIRVPQLRLENMSETEFAQENLLRSTQAAPRDGRDAIEPPPAATGPSRGSDSTVI